MSEFEASVARNLEEILNPEIYQFLCVMEQLDDVSPAQRVASYILEDFEALMEAVDVSGFANVRDACYERFGSNVEGVADELAGLRIVYKSDSAVLPGDLTSAVCDDGG